MCGSASKESICNVGEMGLIPKLGRSPGEGKGYPLQYSGLENSMDCIVMGSQRVEHNWVTFTFHMIRNFFKNCIVKYSIQFLSPSNRVSLPEGKACYQCVPTDIFSLLLLIFHTYTNMNTSFSVNGITLYILFCILTFFTYMFLMSSHEKNILSNIPM